MTGSGRWPSRMFGGSSREAFPGCPVAIGRLSQMTESGWEALPDVWVLLGDPPGCP